MENDRGRYTRQVHFPAWGEAGQDKLAQARVAVVGCGGLGCVVATLLVRAGVGYVRLIDGDQVSLDNLHRQILFYEQDVGSDRFKASVAAERLKAANSSVTIEDVVERVTPVNVHELLGDMDVFVDATDNLATRFLINEVAVHLGRPWIYGGVSGASGMTMTVIPGETPCFRCLFSEGGEGLHSAVPGQAAPAVINTIVAAVASVQCTEVYKLLIDRERVRKGLLTFDLWEPADICLIPVERDPSCPICGPIRS